MEGYGMNIKNNIVIIVNIINEKNELSIIDIVYNLF
uniref:Uncharacterized protein n=1 Tax=viral metagenome TaxID=1070528 RepID=A0A6C0EW73_9ZZZZ